MTKSLSPIQAGEREQVVERGRLLRGSEQLHELLLCLLGGDDAGLVSHLDELEGARSSGCGRQLSLVGSRSDPCLDEASWLLAHDVVERVHGSTSSRADAPALFLEPAEHEQADLLALFVSDDELSLARRLAENLRECGAKSVLLRSELLHG